MLPRHFQPVVLSVVMCLAASMPLAAQSPAAGPAPAPEPKIWDTSVGAGLAVTSGNSDTRNLNVSLQVTRDPKTTTVFSLSGIYVRGSKDGERNADNALANTRLAYTFSPRTFAFAQVQYLRDKFKAIDAYVAPTAGIGYRLTDSDKGSLAIDASVGASWEKGDHGNSRTNPVIAVGQKFSRKLSATATVAQSLTATLVANDPGDALYTFGAVLAATLTGKTQVKIEFLDTYKNRPQSATVEKNDISTIFAIVYKF